MPLREYINEIQNAATYSFFGAIYFPYEEKWNKFIFLDRKDFDFL